MHWLNVVLFLGQTILSEQSVCKRWGPSRECTSTCCYEWQEFVALDWSTLYSWTAGKTNAANCGLYAGTDTVCTSWIGFNCNQPKCDNMHCTPCPDGKVCPEHSGRVGLSFNNYEECIYPTSCPLGTHYGGVPCNKCSQRKCTPCALNHYCPDENQQLPCQKCVGEFYKIGDCNITHNTICKKCPENSETDGQGNTYLNCVCKLGYYGRVISPTESTCKLCPPNKFCPRPNNTRVCPCNGTQ
jgi:hypothetical protein